MSWRTLTIAILLLPLMSCSTYDSLFYDAAPEQAQAVEQAVDHSNSPPNQDCVRVATERADDAVMAVYVSDGSAEQQAIYQSTYSDCVAWHGR